MDAMHKQIVPYGYAGAVSNWYRLTGGQINRPISTCWVMLSGSGFFITTILLIVNRQRIVLRILKIQRSVEVEAWEAEGEIIRIAATHFAWLRLSRPRAIFLNLIIYLQLPYFPSLLPLRTRQNLIRSPGYTSVDHAPTRGLSTLHAEKAQSSTYKLFIKQLHSSSVFKNTT